MRLGESPQRKISAIARWSASLDLDLSDVEPPDAFHFETLHLDVGSPSEVCHCRCNTPVASTSPPDGNSTYDVPAVSTIQDGALEFQREVGSGAFGCVFAARVKMDGRTVAVKRSKIDPNFYDRELPLLVVLSEAQTANVVKLLGHYRVQEPNGDLLQFLVFELMPASLSGYLSAFASRKMFMPFEQTISCLDQIANGLAGLHRHNICHRDLKPDNVLVNMEAGVVKICDLGSAKVLSGSKAGITYIGTRYYRAPELLSGIEDYTLAIDVWALGCIFAELLSGKVLFNATSNACMIAMQVRCRADVLERPRQDDSWSLLRLGLVRSILGGLLSFEPTLRLQAQQVSELTSGLVDSIVTDYEQSEALGT